MAAQRIVLYSLTTCAFCTATKKMLDDLSIDYQCIQADELSDGEREKVIEELKTLNPRCSFPTVVIESHVIVGYKVQEIKEKLGVRTEVDDLFDRLQKINEPKGYFFNSDREKTFELLRSLLINKDRYGYTACPCRLASGKRERDRDIICPCEYREPDVAEYGSCYCSLYVSEDWNSGSITRRSVPERRPPELY
jgi:ferredoxin-thioredoxin reductase catalytic subunit/glutaredoxin